MILKTENKHVIIKTRFLVERINKHENHELINLIKRNSQYLSLKKLL